MKKIIVLFFILSIENIFAQQNRIIQWYTPKDNARIDKSIIEENTKENVTYLIIKSDVEQLKQFDIKIDGYAGENAFFCKINKNDLSSISKNYEIGFLATESKISKELVDVYSLSTSSVIYIQVRFFEGTTVDAIKIDLEKIGLNTSKINTDFSRFVCKGSYEDVLKLATLPYVKFISSKLSASQPLLYDGYMLNNMYGVGTNSPEGYQLTGKGIKVGVWDGGVVGPHIDFRDNVYNVDKDFYATGSSNHATHVTGTIVAGALLNPKNKGMAPEAQVYVWNYNKDDLVEDFKNSITTPGTVVNNHSYYLSGPYPFYCGISGQYVTESADLDKLINENPTITEVFAVGNSGSLCGPYNTIMPGFQASKNVINVGWTDLNDTLWIGSSTGPTLDGRIKPDVVAKGAAVTSTYANDTYGFAWGSSHAAPQVAGIIALMYEQYKSQFGTNPNTALIKSIVDNTAKDLGNYGPDYRYGYGQIDALEAINTIAESRFAEATISTNGIQNQVINVPTDLKQVKVTLAWTDKEASLPATKTLVNDLDLIVIAPDGSIIKPFILQPNNPSALAVQGRDSINNVEQIIIETPIAGNYTIRVLGTKIPFGPQKYALSWMFKQAYIAMSYPKGGEVIPANTSERIRWEGLGIAANVNIELSVDSGSTWTVLAADLDYTNVLNNNKTWAVPNILAIKKAQIRVSSGSLSYTSGFFSIMPQPTLTVSTQCEGSVTLNTTGFATADTLNYYMIADTGLVYLGSSKTTFLVKNLSIGKKYWFAVEGIKSNIPSRRSLAISVTPDINNCTRNQDIGIAFLDSPLGGRNLTSLSLSNAPIKVVVKNFGTTTMNSYSVNYSLNDGAVVSTIINKPIIAKDTDVVVFETLENFSAIGNYNLKIWTAAASDAFFENDTQNFIIRHVPNNAISLPYREGFENSNIEIINKIIAPIGFDALDFYPEFTGRIRNNEHDGLAATERKALTIDNYKSGVLRNNEVIYTLNLSNYIDSIIFLDFKYMHRAEKNGNDKVYARGSDTDPWVEIYDLFENRIDSGFYKSVKNINLTKILKIKNGQNFSTSTQLKIVYNGDNVAQGRFSFGGYTFDDIYFYSAGKDLGLIKIDVPNLVCENQSLIDNIKVSVVNNTIESVVPTIINYSINNGIKLQDTLTDVIEAGDTVQFFLNNIIPFLTLGNNVVKVWVDNSGDNFRENDTASIFTISKFPTIATYPYFQNFETSTQNYAPVGINSSWTLGTPNKREIKGAVSGNNAWITNLTDRYNSLEQSSLVLGCLDMSSFTTDPMISFQHAVDLESGYDDVQLEYTYDNGQIWKNVGAKNTGYNWYNSDSATLFWDKSRIPWQVASNQIPMPTIEDATNFAILRFRLRTDRYANYDGFGIDDIHIFENPQTIASTDSIILNAISTGSGNWLSIYDFGGIVAEINDKGQNLGNIKIRYIDRLNTNQIDKGRYLFRRSWAIETDNEIVTPIDIKLYFDNSDFLQYAAKFEDSILNVYNLSLFNYNSFNNDAYYFNNLINQGSFIDSTAFKIYPYNSGYFLSFTTNKSGEFYLLDKRNNPTARNFANIIDLEAKKFNNEVLVEWVTSSEFNAKWFVVEYALDGQSFAILDTIYAEGNSLVNKDYNYYDNVTPKSGVIYYRITAYSNINNKLTSLMDTVDFTITPVKNNISMNTSFITNGIDIYFSTDKPVNGDLYIYNSNGQLMFFQKLQMIKGVNRVSDSKFINFAAGEYIINFISDNKNQWSGKTIKTK